MPYQLQKEKERKYVQDGRNRKKKGGKDDGYPSFLLSDVST